MTKQIGPEPKSNKGDKVQESIGGNLKAAVEATCVLTDSTTVLCWLVVFCGGGGGGGFLVLVCVCLFFYECIIWFEVWERKKTLHSRRNLHSVAGKSTVHF